MIRHTLKIIAKYKGLIFYGWMSNEAAIIVAKDADMFLLLIYVLDQFECFLPYRI